MAGSGEAMVGIVLAGGLARRMGGGDKALSPVGGRTILSRLRSRFEPDCDALAISANGDPARFAASGLIVLPDPVAGRPGPLAGILAGLDWAAARHRPAGLVLSLAGDCPFLPPDLPRRLAAARRASGASVAVAASGGRTHPVNGLWPVSLREALRRALVEEGLRKVGALVARLPHVVVDWPAEPFDPFLNANTPADLAEADGLAARFGI